MDGDLDAAINNGADFYTFKSIAICSTGNIFGTDNSGGNKLFFREGVTDETPSGTTWTVGEAGVCPDGMGNKHVSCGFRGYHVVTTTGNNAFLSTHLTVDNPNP
jgi:hypothetical protein